MPTRALRLPHLLLLASFCATGAIACVSEEEATNAETGDENDLTSITARSRTLEFVGTVYVAPGASQDQILQTVRTQAQTAFGPLRTADLAVSSRELREIDTSTFVKRPVKVVDVASGSSSDMLEVKYTYKDNAIVGLRYSRRTTAPLALMSPNYREQTDRLLRECTTNDSHARDFATSGWYIFEPTLPQCQDAIRAEQEKIAADRRKLTDARTQVTKSDADRLYLPITAKLGADKTNRGASYPDYQRLYKGGVKSDKLVISLVYGLIDDGARATPSGDYNWGELMTTLGEVMDAQGELKVAAGPDNVDLSRFQLRSGKVVQNPSFKDLVDLKLGRSAIALSATDKKELEKLFAERIYRKWIAVEKPIKVAIGNEAPRDFAVQFLVYWGAESDARPHKYATKNSDVFLYNGHSSIGYGPLDPRNFTAADFAKSYQILWVDGCVSYNYYHKDYIPLKEGGTQNLDLITNGIEAPSWQSGHAMGQWLTRFLDGSGSSYKTLLQAASDTEAMRVVDGELDNEFRPDRFRISITGR